MDFLDLVIHGSNLAAPALWLALLLPLSSRLVMPATPGRIGLGWQMAALGVLGIAVLVTGLVWSGKDGKMLTYGALTAVVATGQWALLRAWR